MFYLSFREIERLGQLFALSTDDVVILLESVLQLEQLAGREGRPYALGFAEGREQETRQISRSCRRKRCPKKKNEKLAFDSNLWPQRIEWGSKQNYEGAYFLFVCLFFVFIDESRMIMMMMMGALPCVTHRYEEGEVAITSLLPAYMAAAASSELIA